MAEPRLGPGPARLLFTRRVKDLIAGPAVTGGLGASVAALARLMTERRVGSVVVLDGQGAPVGIVTDRDLRSRVVAAGRPGQTTLARDVMSTPLAAIGPGALAFEAVLEMTRAGIHHLPVIEDGRLLGVVSSHDVLLWQTRHPIALAREIEAAATLAALRELAGRVAGLVQDLLAEAGTPYDIGQLVAELNDRLVQRVLALVTVSAGPPPTPYCWLVFGSEGRREQTLRTDQDHGLVYGDPAPSDAEMVRDYFLRLGVEVTEGLVEVGFPRCPGEIMASNPRWCRPVGEWAALFRGWMEETSPEHILAAAIFFDLRPLGGQLELGRSLAGVIREEAPGQVLFLRRLAEDVATARLPLTLLGNVAVERGGPHRGTVDIKRAGSQQLVGAARLHALALGLAETNTVDRFRQAGTRGLYPGAEVADLTDAYQHLLRLRLGHQLSQIQSGAPPDNHLLPRRLSRADAVLFREALHTVARLQASLGERYMVGLLR